MLYILKLTLAPVLSLISCTSIGKSNKEAVVTSKTLNGLTDPMYSQPLRCEDQVTVPHPSAVLARGGLCSLLCAHEKVLPRGAV